MTADVVRNWLIPGHTVLKLNNDVKSNMEVDTGTGLL
jgi:hypothetical protein